MWSTLHASTAPEHAVCDELLRLGRGAPPPRPAIVATAARIVAANAAEGLVEDIVEQAERAEGRVDEMQLLIRALALMDRRPAWQLLWRRFAVDLAYRLEWPAAQALARGGPGAFAAIEGEAERLLDEAEAVDDRHELARTSNNVGFALGSLGWILPSLRDGESASEGLYRRIEALCLDPMMAPLRGEMSLVHGLKLAITDRPDRTDIADTAKRLLTADKRLRFWHARLDLVHVLTIHAWERTTRASELRTTLAAVKRQEKHPLVLAALRLGLKALRAVQEHGDDVRADHTLLAYVWSHDDELVGGRLGPPGEVSRLGADVVLLNNLLYGLPEDDRDARGSELAQSDELPGCLRSLDRRQIGGTCACSHGLCGNERGHPAIAPRAPFSESFCRRQARLARESGAPAWVTRNPVRRRRARDHLAEFWLDMEDAAHTARHAGGAGVSS
jgi:hypothetical protein